jgi:hypothetical protein
MSTDAIAAAQHLVDILVRENDALKHVDYAAAVALIPDKDAALTELASHGLPAGFPLQLATSIRDLAAENQALLTLAITVQTRIVQIVARACTPPKGEARYSALSGKSPPERAVALSLSTRA